MHKYREIFIKDGALDQTERMRVYGSSRISLLQKEEGQVGRDYLFSKRNLDVRTVANFRLGYVPMAQDHVFCGRIVMPIFDPVGELLALSVRPVDDGIDPKYWNESFDKGENLFGLDLAKYSIAKLDLVIVVEGQFDVMAMHSHGFDFTVGLLGGAFTPEQAMLLKNLCKNVVLLMDADEPGKKHAKRAVEVLDAYTAIWKKGEKFRQSMKYAIATLPDGMDPDKYLSKYGANSMRSRIADALASKGIEIPMELIKK